MTSTLISKDDVLVIENLKYRTAKVSLLLLLSTRLTENYGQKRGQVTVLPCLPIRTPQTGLESKF